MGHIGTQELVVIIAVVGLILLGLVVGIGAIIYVICKAAQKPRPPSQE